MKNNSEEMLRVAGIEVLKPYASLEMRNMTKFDLSILNNCTELPNSVFYSH